MNSLTIRTTLCEVDEAEIFSSFLDEESEGTWVAQLVKHPTLDLGSGHDLMVHGIKPHVRLCAASMEPAWDSPYRDVSIQDVSLSPCLSSALSPSLSLKNI